VTLPLSYSRLGRKPAPLEPIHPFYGTTRSPVNSLRKRMSERGDCHLNHLFAEDPHFTVLVVHVHREIVEVIEQFLQILRLELAQVDLHTVLTQRTVHVDARLGWY
jgi:hypothetical protein